MYHFDALDATTQQAYHDQMVSCAEAFGGKNYFLQLIEALRDTKPHPLIEKNCAFQFTLGKITWGKVIFNDKVLLLAKVRDEATKEGNILHEKGTRAYKNAMNLIRTLHPIIFEVKPKNSNDGAGFSIQAFDTVNEDTVRLNPVFEALFFAPVSATKKILAYKAK